MTRTAPDPVFAAAAQQELERRVRAHRRSAQAGVGRPGRRWVMELSAIGGIAVLAAGVAVGVTSLRPTPENGAPVGAITRTVGPEPTATAPTTAAPLPTGTPTATAPPATDAPTPPVTTPPATTPPASTDPTTPPPTRGTALIGPAGSVQRSDAQIRAYAAAQGFSDVWAQQGILDRDCMAAQGFLYDPLSGLTAGGGMSAADSAAWKTALLGPETDAPYDWRTAGCHGASVHETGLDDAN